MASAETNPWLKRKKSRREKKDPRLIWRTLRAIQGKFTAEAIWKAISGQWVLVQATPAIDGIIATMKPQEAQKELSARGWKCSWL